MVLKITDTAANYNLGNLVIFYGLKDYFTSVQLEHIYKMIIYRQLKVIIIQQTDCREALEDERIVLIDEDFDRWDL